MSDKTAKALDVWRKPAACDNSSGNCAEVIERSDKTWAVRNSRQPGLAITYDSDEWAAFIGAAKGVGVLAVLLRLGDGADMTFDKLAELGSAREGRDAMRAAKKELVKYGYAVEKKVTDGSGKWRTEVYVYADPDRPRTDNPSSVRLTAIPGELGRRKLPRDTSDIGNADDGFSVGRFEQPKHAQPTPDNPSSINGHGETDQSQDLNVASMGGDKPTAHLIETARTRKGEAENRQTVASISVPDLWPAAAWLYDR